MTPLTANQSRVLDALAALSAERGKAPTILELAARCGFSGGYTHYVIRTLERKGRIQRKPHAHRGIQLIGA